MPAAITILGLGPGDPKELTLAAYELLSQADANQQVVYFRTIVHPLTDSLTHLLPNLRIEAFDRLYDTSDDWASLYQQIAEEICGIAQQHPVIYAVPGHPLVGETSVQNVLQLAHERHLNTEIIAGVSFLEVAYTHLQLDPLHSGIQILEATDLAALRTDELGSKIIPTMPLLIAQIYNRRLASAVKLALNEYYPDEWPIKLVHTTRGANEEALSEIPLYELDRQNFATPRNLVFIPPVDEMTALRTPETLRYITMRLRRDPDGCPWDREQTHQSLTKYVIEETYEVVEALEENDMEKLAEELGDLLLQVYLHAEIGRQEKTFTLGDVLENINAKLIRRHPHVFGNVEVSNAGQVVQNWEAIKRQERASTGENREHESILAHIPPALPALLTAQEYQKRVSKAGFEFADPKDIFTKVEEEFAEIKQANTYEERLEEIGDLLFMLAKLAQSFKIDAEEALRYANRKFRQRFQSMEEQIHSEGRPISSYSTTEWLTLWNNAKDRVK